MHTKVYFCAYYPNSMNSSKLVSFVMAFLFFSSLFVTSGCLEETTKNDVINKDDSTDYNNDNGSCLLYTSPSPRDATLSRMPSSA